MDTHLTELNRFLVNVFNEILKSEEESLNAYCDDLSLRELHLIDELCLVIDQGKDNRSTEIAAVQRVTASSLTTAVTYLEKKGYLYRLKDEKDRRIVRIFPTEKAREVNRFHTAFHKHMVEQVTDVLTTEEAQILVRALGGLTTFFKETYQSKELSL